MSIKFICFYYIRSFAAVIDGRLHNLNYDKDQFIAINLLESEIRIKYTELFTYEV